MKKETMMKKRRMIMLLMAAILAAGMFCIPAYAAGDVAGVLLLAHDAANAGAGCTVRTLTATRDGAIVLATLHLGCG